MKKYILQTWGRSIFFKIPSISRLTWVQILFFYLLVCVLQGNYPFHVSCQIYRNKVVHSITLCIDGTSFIPDISNLCLLFFPLISLARSLTILWIFTKNQPLVLLIFSVALLFFVSLIFFLIFIVFFFLLTLVQFTLFLIS